MLPFGMNSKVHEHARPKLFGFQLLVSRLQRVLKWIEVGSQKGFSTNRVSICTCWFLRNACPHDELEECYICFWTHLLLVLVFWSCQRSFGCWPPVSVLQRTGHEGDSVKSCRGRTNDDKRSKSSTFVQEDQVAATGVQHFGPNSLHVRWRVSSQLEPSHQWEAQGAAGVSPVKIRHD